MKKSVIIILVLYIIVLYSGISMADEYKIYTNTDQIYFEITSLEKNIKSNEIRIEIYKNKDNKIKKQLFIQCTDLMDKEGNIIPAKKLNIRFLNNINYSRVNNKILLNKYEGEILFNIGLDQTTSSYPPGEYRGNLSIGDGIYNIPIILKINTFAQLFINKDIIHFNLSKPAANISNKEEIEIYVNTNLENWEVAVEFSEKIIHENGICSFPLENLLYRKGNKYQNKKKISNTNLENIQNFSSNSFNNNRGNYSLKLDIWADIRDNWNRVLAGEYTGKIYVTFISND